MTWWNIFICDQFETIQLLKGGHVCLCMCECVWEGEQQKRYSRCVCVCVCRQEFRIRFRFLAAFPSRHFHPPWICTHKPTCTQEKHNDACSWLAHTQTHTHTQIIWTKPYLNCTEASAGCQVDSAGNKVDVSVKDLRMLLKSGPWRKVLPEIFC